MTDALQRAAFRYTYDLANRPLYTWNFDAGWRRMVLDAAGSEVERRDSKGSLILRAYDALNRPARLWARDQEGERVTLRERLIYGDSAECPLSLEQKRAANLPGKLYRHDDEAGRLEFQAYDFKGNLLEKTRRVIGDVAILRVFSFASAQLGGACLSGLIGMCPALPFLDSTIYATTSTYDALNRVKTMTYPQDVEGRRKVLRPGYNRAGALESVALDDETYVERIAYDAKGQRTLISYGNQVMTRYAYDERTFRLVRLRTEGFEKPGDLTYQPAGPVLQDIAYTYDLVGNILGIADRTPNCGVLDNPPGKDALDRIFTYDPIYRLLSATGRECSAIPAPRPWGDWNHADCGYVGQPGTPTPDNSPHQTKPYREDYQYDPAGNMLAMSHSFNGTPGWTRHFGMGGLPPKEWDQAWREHLNGGDWDDPPGNQLTHVGDDDPSTPQTHIYDPNGNLISETTSRHFEWDHSDRMRVYRTQTAGAKPSVHAHYLYDAAGQRVKKLVRKQGGGYEVTVYIDGVFEHHRLVSGNSAQENNTLHVMDNQSRVALVRAGAPFPDDGVPEAAVKYQLGDHLGSSSVVIGGQTVGGNTFINREEYFPYGETSFGSFGRKRYRFTGKERDEESGLYYYGARYYAPEMTRWVTCDKVRSGTGAHLYRFALNSPMRYLDLRGAQETECNTVRIDPERTAEAMKMPLLSDIKDKGAGSKEFEDRVKQANKYQMGIRVTEGVLDPGQAGIYLIRSNVIILRENALRGDFNFETLDTITHEITHALQDREFLGSWPTESDIRAKLFRDKGLTMSPEEYTKWFLSREKEAARSGITAAWDKYYDERKNIWEKAWKTELQSEEYGSKEWRIERDLENYWSSHRSEYESDAMTEYLRMEEKQASEVKSEWEAQKAEWDQMIFEMRWQRNQTSKPQAPWEGGKGI